MPYVLSPLIKAGSAGMWNEGPAYEKKNIYSIEQGKLPPVHYDEHLLRPHSLTHFETPAHTIGNGHKLDYYLNNNPKFFYGPTLVVKLPGNNYKKVSETVYHWEISRQELEAKIGDVKKIGKILITSESYPLNEDGYHDPNFVLTLSQEAADYLISFPDFHLYGTSWKSSDFKPGLKDRPIHNTLFSKALVLENLKLDMVPEGLYFMSAFPLPLSGSSETPVVPVLFSKDELFENW